MGQQFKPFLGNILPALYAGAETSILDPGQCGFDLLDFFLTLNTKAFQHLVSGDFSGAFLEIGFRAMFLEVVVYLTELGCQ